MDSITLHTMARRYLMSRNEKLHAEYAELPNDGRFLLGYTKEAKQIYPRYNVVDAMLSEVERLDPDDLPSPDVVADALSTAAATAQSAFTTRLSRTEKKATAEERELFGEAIQVWSNDEDLAVEPLPYWRVLRDEEAEGWHHRLAERWDAQGTTWHPMIGGDVPAGVLVVSAAAVTEGPGTEKVRDALRDMGVHRVVELREHGDPGSLIGLDAFEPTYTGAEGIWTDETLDWVAYASHESSVAFGGTLAERLRTSWPDHADWGWAPWSDQPAK
ncbi:hypothetical protein GCM10011609_49740 [Lentzea pudingi]|uniref:Uncharacterized protein n=1 Tax=Lentzea pudingi TaxID=1789439 RepID=A0ABQ2I9F7_9PSEU|nr:hypothetical protein [Lentzea pudingi]GGN04500.1 hypothetical protein GCM10011609_49740 [Lentzea pudingi]